MKISFLTGHTPGGRRKASILAMAEALADTHQVSVVRVGSSVLQALLKRPHAEDRGFPINTQYTTDTGLVGFIAHPLFHPFNLRNQTLNRLAAPLFRFYARVFPLGAWQLLEDADLVICESGLGVMLMPELAKRRPNQARVYSVSDRMATLSPHPLVLEAEREALPFFTLIRVPAGCMLADYKGRPAIHVPQGVAKQAFQEAAASPFRAGQNAVVVGDMLFDEEAVTHLAETFPAWRFHLFGRNARIPKPLPNVTMYGEVSFAEVIPFIKFADIGLAPYRPAPDAEYLSQSSLKLIQYTYCKLPIVAPTFAASGRPHVLPYDPGSEGSLIAAFQKAAIFDRRSISDDAARVRDWPEVADFLVSQVQQMKAVR